MLGFFTEGNIIERWYHLIWVQQDRAGSERYKMRTGVWILSRCGDSRLLAPSGTSEEQMRSHGVVRQTDIAARLGSFPYKHKMSQSWLPPCVDMSSRIWHIFKKDGKQQIGKKSQKGHQGADPHEMKKRQGSFLMVGLVFQTPSKMCLVWPGLRITANLYCNEDDNGCGYTLTYDALCIAAFTYCQGALLL